LNYKIKIEPPTQRKTLVPFSNLSPIRKENRIEVHNNITNIKQATKCDEVLLSTSYFANEEFYDAKAPNQSKYDQLNFAIETNELINLKIISFDKDIISKLQKFIQLFFLLNNFGTRSNKGFGSFTVEKIDGKKIMTNDLVNEHFSFKSKRSESKPLKFIKDEYQLLKSGINLFFTDPPKYKKSELFKYFIKKKIRWEKRFLKRKINTEKINDKSLKKSSHSPIDLKDNDNKYYNSYNDNQENQYKFVRALLGLAQEYEFQSSDNDKYIVSIEHIPTKDTEKIERFKSPLFFKVINGFIYLKANNSYESLYNKEFEFKYNLKKAPNKKGNTKVPYFAGKLKVPSEFDINEFLSKDILTNWKKIN